MDWVQLYGMGGCMSMIMMAPGAKRRVKNKVIGQGPGDPYWANVVLLIDETTVVDGSTTFTDLSSNPKTITPSGNIQWDTAVTINGKPTILTDGTGDYLSLASTSDFGFGTGAFTWEIWLNRWANTVGDEQIMDFRPSGPTNAMMYVTSGNDRLGYYNGTVFDGGSAIAVGSPVFLSMSRTGGVLYGAVNGVNTMAINPALGDFTSARALKIFANFANTANIKCNANMIRVTKGIGRYTATTFTPPTSYPHF
jgi:hypothetical protein